VRLKVFLIAMAAAVGCGTSSAGGASDPDPFAAVDQALRDAYERRIVPGLGLAIYDQAGVKRFERMYGDFSPDRRVAIASASKLVSGVTLFRLIDQGYLSLDTTTGQVLGWRGERGTITLRQLLSFTSGLEPEDLCTVLPGLTLAACVDLIARNGLAGAPATRFDYGSTHLAVAGRMAEVATGRSWDSLFGSQLREPLGLPSDLVYYATPRQPVPTDNPLLAGGLRASMNEYARVLRLVYDKGRWLGQPLLQPAIFDTQAIEPYPSAVIGNSPMPSLRYGLTAWLECPTPQLGCARLSSPGAFGFAPWLDRAAGYFAVLGMEIPERSEEGNLGVTLERTLQPLIVEALLVKSSSSPDRPASM